MSAFRFFNAKTQEIGREFWSAMAKRSGDTAFRWRTQDIQSGVALRFPPQSKRFALRPGVFATLR